MKQELFQAQLIDPWRILHPTTRDFSFYSIPHNMYSRIDFFLINHRDLPMVKKRSIETVSLSDHAPITIEMSWGDNQMKGGHWRRESVTRRSYREGNRLGFGVLFSIKSYPRRPNPHYMGGT